MNILETISQGIMKRADSTYIEPKLHIEDAFVETEAVLNKMFWAETFEQLAKQCYSNSYNAGWWHDSEEGIPLYDRTSPRDVVSAQTVATKLCRIHSEISEAMEGHRKGLNDDKLPHRSMIEVELADAVIRIMDLAGALNLDIGGAIAEKMTFNQTRPDRDIVNRRKPGGKLY
jgi:NTP pyrophosphatase (non-canonical NTP hydrolase)